MEKLMSDEEIAQALETYVKIPKVSAQDWLMDMLSFAPMLLGIPAAITYKEGLRQLGKSFRQLRKLPRRKGGPLAHLSEVEFATHEKKVFKTTAKALKKVPESELAKTEAVGFWRGISDYDDWAQKYTLRSGKPRIKTRTTQPIEEVEYSLFHEFGHAKYDPNISEVLADQYADVLKELGK